MIEIVVNTRTLEGSINLVGENGVAGTPQDGDRLLAERSSRTDLERDPMLPDFIRQWGLVQHLSGGPWKGCIEDIDALEARLS